MELKELLVEKGRDFDLI